MLWLAGDHLGSTAIVANADGSFYSSLRYKPWGEIRYANGVTPTPYQYTGQRNETAIGLYFYNARWYDYTIGRFVQADTIVPAGAQGLDRYAYTANNPVKYTDPSGHCIDSSGNVNMGQYPYGTSGLCEVPLTYSGEEYITEWGTEEKHAYGGQEVYNLYLRMKGQTDGWWYEDGDCFCQVKRGAIVSRKGARFEWWV